MCTSHCWKGVNLQGWDWSRQNTLVKIFVQSMVRQSQAWRCLPEPSMGQGTRSGLRSTAAMTSVWSAPCVTPELLQWGQRCFLRCFILPHLENVPFKPQLYPNLQQ